MQRLVIGLCIVVGLGGGLWFLMHTTTIKNVPESISTSPATTTPTLEAASNDGWSTTTLQIGSTTIFTRIANTPTTRRQGLSGQPSLGAFDGLLFVFPESHQPGFWMKDMNFAIDIIWINTEGTIVDITENFTPDTYVKQEVVQPVVPVQYVLEVNAFFAAEQGIAVGDRVRLPVGSTAAQ